MFKRILIPLDGSQFAERALQPGFDIARAFGAEVVLLRAVALNEALVGLPGLTPAMTPSYSLMARAEENGAEEYLRQISQRWSSEGVAVGTKVVAGAAASAIVGAAQEAGADLIVMSTHGRSAVGRIIYGSVAEAVLRGAQVPVLLIPVRLPE